MPSLGAQTNYMANMGSGIVWQSAIGPNVGMPQPNGVFYGDRATTFAAITDGLSNTTFYSERVLADGNNSIVSPIADVFFSPGFPDDSGRGNAAYARPWISTNWTTSFHCSWVLLGYAVSISSCT